MHKQIQIIRHFILFCGVGVINTLISLAIILALSSVFNVKYYIANFIGYIAGLLIGYILHSKITFKANTEKRTFSHILNFIAVFVFAYLIQLAFLYKMIDVWGWNSTLSQILAVGVFTVLNFSGNRFLTFKIKQDNLS